MPSQFVITIDRSVVTPIVWALLCYWGYCLIVRIAALWLTHRLEVLKAQCSELEEELKAGALGRFASPSVEQLRGIREHFRARHSL